MKTFLTLIVGLVLSANALAYVSAPSGDPVHSGFVDVETKTVVKSTTDGYSDAISKGHALFYENAALTGLYTVSRDYSGTSNSALASRLNEACIATHDVATGDVGAFPCATKGYVDYALYSAVATFGNIVAGDYLCISDQATSKGRLVPCASGIISKFVALESKSTTADGTIKIKIGEK